MTMTGTLPALARSTAQRAVHLHISPRLTSIGESRELLRVISRFGEVEMYKSLKYDKPSLPRSAAVIFRDEAAARECIKQSPLRFYMGRSTRAPITAAQQESKSAQAHTPLPSAIQSKEPKQPESPIAGADRNAKTIVGGWGLSAEILAEPPSRYRRESSVQQNAAVEVQSNQDNLAEQESGTSNISESTVAPERATSAPVSMGGMKLFNVNVSPAYMNFREAINNSRLHGSYSLDTKSAAQVDLAERVPLLGLSDLKWQGTRPWRMIEAEQRQENEGPGRRKTLRELYDEYEPEGTAQANASAADKDSGHEP